MPEHRCQFSRQVKAEAVRMLIETGRPIAEVARDPGIRDATPGTG
jgi:transposase-like protein